MPKEQYCSDGSATLFQFTSHQGLVYLLLIEEEVVLAQQSHQEERQANGRHGNQQAWDQLPLHW